MKKGNSHRFWRFLQKVFIVLVVICAVLLVKHYVIRKQGEAANERMRSLFPEALAESEIPQVQDSFSDLLEVNPDTVGWLKVGQNIRTAVTQRDNLYYLTHNFFGGKSAEGMAFMDEGCSIWPADTHLLIHGHNMKNGTVFGTLDDFRQAEYLKNYPLIEFGTIYENKKYVIFAVFDISSEPDNGEFMNVQQYRFDTDDKYMDFVNSAKKRSIFEIPIDVNAGENLISLATCSYGYENGRLIIMGRELRNEETIESVQEFFRNMVMN